MQQRGTAWHKYSEGCVSHQVSNLQTLPTAASLNCTCPWQVTGELRLNGQTYSQKALKAIGGYVMQDDVLNTALVSCTTCCVLGV